MIDMMTALDELLLHQRLTPLFQPIIDLRSQQCIGYEALIRGPVNSHLHLPGVLFKVARQYEKVQELEVLCCQIQVEAFVRLGLTGLLFLNFSPDLFIHLSRDTSPRPWAVANQQPQPQVVIELSESESTYDYEQLRIAVEYSRREKIQFAIDDLGEGYASLRLWAELQPEFVKLDRYFIQHIHKHPFKQRLLKGISDVARSAKTCVIAEGIESQAELSVLQDLGVSHGQGFYLGKPTANPLVDQVMAFKPLDYPLH